MHGDPGIMPVLCWAPVDPGNFFLGAGIVLPAHFGVWDRDPGWVPGHRPLWGDHAATVLLGSARMDSRGCRCWNNTRQHNGKESEAQEP